jgi:hypothetical protein
MATDNLDILHITKVGIPDDNPSSALAFPSPSLDTSRSQAERCSWRRSRPTPILRLAHSGSAANSIVSRDNNQAPFSGHCRKRPTERGANYNPSFRLGPLRSTGAPIPTHTTSSSDAGSRTSSVTRFFRRTVHRVRRSSSSLNGNTGSDTTRNDGQKGDNVCCAVRILSKKLILVFFENRGPFWTILKSAWKPQTNYMEKLLIYKRCTGLEQFLL